MDTRHQKAIAQRFAARRPVAASFDAAAETLAPVAVNLDDACFAPLDELPAETLAVLNNESPAPASLYPIRLETGNYFSEALGSGNPDAADYFAWVAGSLDVLRRAMRSAGAIEFEQIDVLGREIQRLDADFVRNRIDRPPDAVHGCHGVDRSHPYRKTTLCRTAFPVRHPAGTTMFYYEKFLVSYSYWDGTTRRCTVTPVHSHPWNHEVVYFTSFGDQSLVVEEEFRVTDRAGRPIVLDDGTVNPRLVGPDRGLLLGNISLAPFGTGRIAGTSQPIVLEPFSYDEQMVARWNFPIIDGLFRPHRVTVHGESPSSETSYYAVNNYWGPLGRVFVYDDDGGISTWSHAKWTGVGR